MATYQNRSLERAFSILECLGATERGLTVVEIASQTKLHRATVHRLLMVLNQLGYVYKDRVTREYWAGFHLHSFGHRTSMIARLTHHARPFLVTLANEVDESVHLGALEGIQSLVCERIGTARSVRLDRQPGEYLDAHATAVGKALLSLRPEEELRRAYREATMRAHTGRTITNVEGLLRELRQTKARGYAVNDEEYRMGVRSVAAPVLNPAGRALAAIAITGPKARLTDTILPKLGQRAIETARALVGRLLEIAPNDD